jgi:serralysin
MPDLKLPYQEKTVVDFPYSGDYRIDVLLDDPKYRWGDKKVLQYCFPSDQSLILGEAVFSKEQMSAVKAIFDRVSDTVNVKFVEVLPKDMLTGIRFANMSSKQGAGESVGSPGEVVTVHYNPDDVANLPGFDTGTFGWATLVHEIGHALGLKHPGNYNGTGSEVNAKGNFLATKEDTPTNTVMTYTPDSQSLQRDFFGKYDLLALQYLFGKQESHVGDDVYVLDDVVGGSLGILVDDGGQDTIDLSNLTVGSFLDLRPGHESSIGLKADGGPTLANFSLFYGTVIEQVFGTQFDDSYFFSNGLKNLDAGTGLDTVVFSGDRRSFELKAMPDKPSNRTIEVVKAENVFQQAQLRSVEVLKFSDYSVDLTIADVVREVGTNAMNSIAEIYVAYFNRVPDAEGLHYWLEEFKSGKTLEEIGRTFYAVASSPTFKDLTGYSENMSDENFVRIIYKNVLGRQEVDAEGLRYWTGALSLPSGSVGAESRGTLIKTMLASAHSFKGNAEYGWVANLLDNKLATAKYFAFEQGLTLLTPEETYSKCSEICRAVTPTSIDAAIALVGIHDAPLNTIS